YFFMESAPVFLDCSRYQLGTGWLNNCFIVPPLGYWPILSLPILTRFFRIAALSCHCLQNKTKAHQYVLVYVSVPALMPRPAPTPAGIHPAPAPAPCHRETPIKWVQWLRPVASVRSRFPVHKNRPLRPAGGQ